MRKLALDKLVMDKLTLSKLLTRLTNTSGLLSRVCRGDRLVALCGNARKGDQPVAPTKATQTYLVAGLITRPLTLSLAANNT